MKILNCKKNKIAIALAFALLVSVLLSFARFDALCQDLRTNVLRLHILANSDSDDDQELKLKVRDAVLKECGYVFKNNTSLEQAVSTARSNLDVFSSVAQKTITDNGYNYDVSVELCEDFFDTRVYDDFTLPAGIYEALKIKIGDAAGKNWWCVMFPSVCVYSASDTDNKQNNRLDYSTSKQSAYIAEHSEKYVVKFKIVEIYERVKNYFNKS